MISDLVKLTRNGVAPVRVVFTSDYLRAYFKSSDFSLRSRRHHKALSLPRFQREAAMAFHRTDLFFVAERRLTLQQFSVERAYFDREGRKGAQRSANKAVSKCVYGTVARVVYSRLFPDWTPDQTKPQTGRVNKSPHIADCGASCLLAPLS
jgi:hypothetical protein